HFYLHFLAVKFIHGILQFFLHLFEVDVLHHLFHIHLHFLNVKFFHGLLEFFLHFTHVDIQLRHVVLPFSLHFFKIDFPHCFLHLQFHLLTVEVAQRFLHLDLRFFHFFLHVCCIEFIDDIIQVADFLFPIGLFLRSRISEIFFLRLTSRLLVVP